MSLSIFICTVLFSVFSTSVMTYIAIATPIGPWMGPTLALLSISCMKLFPRLTSSSLLLSVIGGSLGGIMATAFGFSFPTLYFLDKEFFNAWAASPFNFIFSVAALACVAGALGLWIASVTARPLLQEQKLSFPVGVLVYKIITAVDNTSKLRQLLAGFVGTVTYCIVQATAWIQQYISTNLTLVGAHTLGWIHVPAVQLSLNILPMLWSIGFIAGSLITIPLLIGTLSKIVIVDLLHTTYFSHLSSSDFIFAFCSGMVVTGAISGLLSMPGQLIDFIKKTFLQKNTQAAGTVFPSVWITLPLVIGLLGVFSYFKFSLIAQLYVILFAAVCAYQIAVIAGKIGLALLGRFATFVMVPGLLLFGFNAVQVTVLATFVEACGGITTEALFGRKAGLLAGVDQNKIGWYQAVGLIVCSLTLGVVLWLLVTHFQLGSEHLFAERAQGRALLVNAAGFNYYVLLCGAIYGLVLKFLKCNPMLVLGGLLMPLSLTLGLVLGGLCSLLLPKEKIDLEPLCSGIFAANSLCMIVQALL